MKLLYLSALLVLMTSNSAFAADHPFVLAMDSVSYLRMADNDAINAAKEFLSENPYEKKEKKEVRENSSDKEEKWNTVKEFNNKLHSVSGGGFVDTNDRVAVGAFAGYEFDEQDETRQNDKYSVTINVKVAL